FLLVGEGAEKTHLKRQAEGLTNVLFWDQRGRAEVAQILAASDLCLVLLRDRPVFRTVIPSKLFECMGAARPIIATVDGEARRILEQAGAGLFSPPEDAPALAELLRLLSQHPDRLEQMGRAGRSYAEAHYSRPALARRY